MSVGVLYKKEVNVRCLIRTALVVEKPPEFGQLPQGKGNASASRQPSQSMQSSRPSTSQSGKEVRPNGASLSGVRSKGRARESAPIEGLPVSKNDETVIEIIGMNHDGEGVGRADGYTLFVQGALLGETVRVRVMKTKKQYGYAKLLEIVKASPDRVSAPCPIYDQCGGCQIQHMSYAGQLAWKRQLVIDNLQRIGKLNVLVDSDTNEEDTEHAIRVLPTMGMDEPWRYRNKAQVPIGVTEGGLVGGFYAKGSHRIIDMETCLIQHEHNDEVVAKVKEIGVPPRHQCIQRRNRPWSVASCRGEKGVPYRRDDARSGDEWPGYST